MIKRRLTFDLDSTQDFYAEGRIDYALQMYKEGAAAVKAKDLTTAIKKLRISARAYPAPTTLRLIGRCLLRQGRPADATLYLAAAVGITTTKTDKRSVLLLTLALLRARENLLAGKRLEEIVEAYPEMAEALSTNPDLAIERLLRNLRDDT